jgi:general secretion pathway protein G
MCDKKDEGFTFIETIIVLSIILILSAGVGFSAIKYVEHAKVVSCKQQLSSFKMALQSYYLDCGTYPSSNQGLKALWEKPSFAPVPDGWAGPYVDREIPKDSWNNDYIYLNPGENGLPFSIVSLGADGAKGGEKNNADIESWK